MKVLVTGGSGFIGSHVVERLINRGIKVRIYDLVYPEFLEDLSEEKKRLIEFYQGSLLEEDRIHLASATVDAVFHLAAVADVNDVFADPGYAQRINMQGTLNILEAARKSPKKKPIIFASTVWVYQDTPQGSGPLTEDAALSHPSHFYTATKISGEASCVSYSKLYDIPVTVLRFGIPYGPRARDSVVTAIFVKKALNGEALTISGDGSQFRKFVYVEDLAEACVLALKPEARNQIFNLEGNEKVSIRQIADTVRSILGDIEIKHLEGRKGDFSGKEISNQKVKDLLGWEPTTTFDEGMQKYVKWYQEERVKEVQEIKI